MGIGTLITQTVGVIKSTSKGIAVVAKPAAVAGATVAGAALLADRVGSAVSGAFKSSDSKKSDDKDKSADSSLTTSTPTINDLRYPLDIGQTQRYPHFVLFHINANTKSKIIQKDVNGTKSTALTEKRTTSGKQTAALAAASNINVLTNFGVKQEDIDKFVGNHRRLLQSIALPMPGSVAAKYSADYGPISSGGTLGSFFNTLANNGLAQATKGAAMDALLQGSMAAVKIGMMGAAGAATKKLGVGAELGVRYGKESGEASQAILQKISGYAVNERLEQMFKRVDFREFTFDYMFAPRDEQESNMIADIISKFKYHMHPELSDSHNKFFIMPDEFDIEMRFLTGDNSSKENTYIHRIMTCALTSVDVNYSPNNQWATFENGAPVLTHLTLHFRELEPMVRQMAERGF